jgi:hypothetical protein
MNSFLLAFLAGIVIVCSMAGWGWGIFKVLRIRLGDGIGHCAALGLALSTTVGGILNLFYLINPLVLRAYLLAGFLLGAAVAVSRAVFIRRSVTACFAYLKLHKLHTVGVCLVVVVALAKYSAAVSPGQFNPQDDYHAYFVFPVKMIQTGSLGQDPFSERRVVSSLGGEAYLDTFVLSLTGEVRNLSLLDAGVGFIIWLLLLTEIMIHRNISGRWLIVVLLAAALLPVPASNINALYVGIVLLVLLIDLFDRTLSNPSLAQSVLVALILASLASLKTTFAPIAGVFWFSFFLLQLYRSPFRRRTVASAGGCALAIAIFLLPWMLDSYRSSATLLYPVFGKGFHGSRYGEYVLPTANLGAQNVLAFLHGIANTLCVVLGIQGFLLLRRRQWSNRDDLICLTILLNVVLDILIIGASTGGLQVYRYGFIILPAAAFFLLIKLLNIRQSFEPGAPPDFWDGSACWLLLGLLLGTSFDNFITEQQAWRLAALKFGLTGQNIVSPAELASFRELQSSIPSGQKILVRMDKNFLFDFRRNSVYIDDLPGGASLPPGVPSSQGPEALSNYLVRLGIRYLAYSYADEAGFSRAEFTSRLGPNINVWLREQTQMAFNFQDYAVSLSKTRRKLFDNGQMFAIDLDSKIPNSNNRADLPKL